MLRHPTIAALPWSWRLTIWLVRKTKGDVAAARKESELARPERVRVSGHRAIAVGIGLLAGGCLLLAGWLTKAIGC